MFMFVYVGWVGGQANVNVNIFVVYNFNLASNILRDMNLISFPRKSKRTKYTNLCFSLLPS